MRRGACRWSAGVMEGGACAGRRDEGPVADVRAGPEGVRGLRGHRLQVDERQGSVSSAHAFPPLFLLFGGVRDACSFRLRFWSFQLGVCHAVRVASSPSSPTTPFPLFIILIISSCLNLTAASPPLAQTPRRRRPTEPTGGPTRASTTTPGETPLHLQRHPRWFWRPLVMSRRLSPKLT